MSKSKKQKQTMTQKVLWALSVFLIGSMVISLFIVALEPGSPAATPEPTFTEAALPTSTPQATEGPTLQPTEPVIGPELPTSTPTMTPTLTITPLLTATPPAAQPALTFAIVGDSRSNPTVYRKVLASVVSRGSQFLIHTGDMVNMGEESQWQEFSQLMAGFSLPFYPVAGNHDGLNGKLDGYLQYSGATTAHYSFDFGPVHFVMADSHNGGISGAELAWLTESLSATPQPIKMVILHHPAFDPDSTDHIMAYGNDAFMKLMAEQGVDYVVAGHIHAYAQGTRDGVTYLYTGGGGAPLYTAGHPNAFYHYLLVSVTGDEVAIEVVKV